MALMTFAAKNEAPSLTADEIIAAMINLTESLPPEPFAQFMQEQGHDPKDGWILVFPKIASRICDGGILPSYVLFSHVIDTPFFIKKPDHFGIESFV